MKKKKTETTNTTELLVDTTRKLHKTTFGLWQDFKKFISKGSVLDMAVGVVIGGAFGTIVTAMTNILLSICTWQVPGGLKGLVTPLPASNPGQAGLLPNEGIGQYFNSTDLTALAKIYAESQGLDSNNDVVVQGAMTTLMQKYTLHGTVYYYNGTALIDWGTFLNAIITFLIIALTLFTIVKVAHYFRKKNDAIKALQLEEYYKKFPEERPVPPAVGKPVLSETELLIQIRDELAKQNARAAALDAKQE